MAKTALLVVKSLIRISTAGICKSVIVHV